jgi:hypothetical protein
MTAGRDHQQHQAACAPERRRGRNPCVGSFVRCSPSFFEPIKGSPAEFAAFIDREAARWSKVIKDAKLSVE